MGICYQCYQETNPQLQNSNKTLNLRAGPNFNGIIFTLTNKPIIDLKGECIVFYADHAQQLSQSQSLNSLNNPTKTKIFEYLMLAEQKIEKKHKNQTLIPVSISSLKYKYFLFVKMEPWDGASKIQIEKKIYHLTLESLEVLKLRKIKEFTIIEFDQFSGIHYSLSFPAIAKAIEEYSSHIKRVSIVCNSEDSVDYFYQNIKKQKIDLTIFDNQNVAEIMAKKSDHEEETIMFG